MKGAIFTVTAWIFLTSTAYAGLAIMEQARVALIIANAEYKENILTTPLQDARAMSAILEALGFKVEVITNGTQAEMDKQFKDFLTRTERADIGLLYYAGMGGRWADSAYILPVDQEFESGWDLPRKGFDIRSMLDAMAWYCKGVKLLILDTSQTPLFGWSKSGREDSPWTLPENSAILYAASPGKAAHDGQGHNSPFTGALIEQFQIPGLSFEHIIKAVTSKVPPETHFTQEPWSIYRLDQPVILNNVDTR